MIYRSGHYSETNSETSRKLPCRFVLSHGHVKLYERWLGKTDCFGHNNRYRKINMAVRLHWGNYMALGQLYCTRAVILHWGSYTVPGQLYCTGGSYTALGQLYCTEAVILHWGSYTALRQLYYSEYILMFCVLKNRKDFLQRYFCLTVTCP